MPEQYFRNCKISFLKISTREKLQVIDIYSKMAWKVSMAYFVLNEVLSSENFAGKIEYFPVCFLAVNSAPVALLD